MSESVCASSEGTGETEDLLGSTLHRQVQAETALHNGDPGPRLSMWSPNDPVTLFGAWVSRSGWDEVSGTFKWLAIQFADCSAYDIELVAAGASGDLA